MALGAHEGNRVMPRAAQPASRRKNDYAVHSVENALDLIDAICEEGGEARVSRLSERLGMSKASVFRLLATFENRGFVERSDDSLKYRLGLSAYEMGQKILARMGMLRKARPIMDRLARQCNEAVYFVVRRGSEVLMLDMIDSPQKVKVMPLVGVRFPITTAAGQIFLAFEADVCGHDRKRKGEQNTPELAMDDLESVRSRGFRVDEQGFGDGVTCLAVPLLNGKGHVAAALAILGPGFRMTQERFDAELLPQLREAGANISAGLGYLGGYPR